MFEPAVAAILAHHESRSGHPLMRQTAERALQRGYRLIPPGGSGQAKYLRLVLDAQPPGIPVTLYLQGDRLVANGKQLRPFAASLPGAVTTNRDVQFPLGRVGNDVLDAFAAWSAASAPQPAETPGGGSPALAAVPADTATAPRSTPASAPRAGRGRPGKTSLQPTLSRSRRWWGLPLPARRPGLLRVPRPSHPLGSAS